MCSLWDDVSNDMKSCGLVWTVDLVEKEKKIREANELT